VVNFKAYSSDSYYVSRTDQAIFIYFVVIGTCILIELPTQKIPENTFKLSNVSLSYVPLNFRGGNWYIRTLDNCSDMWNSQGKRHVKLN